MHFKKLTRADIVLEQVSYYIYFAVCKVNHKNFFRVFIMDEVNTSTYDMEMQKDINFYNWHQAQLAFIKLLKNESLDDMSQ